MPVCVGEETQEPVQVEAADILALAKGLGGGIPIGAIVARHDLARLLTPGLHGSTFGGNPLACAAANAVLDVVSAPGFLDHVNSVASLLEQGLRDLFPDREILGRGLLRGVRLEEPVSEFIGRARDAGLIVGPSARNTLRIAPPLVITHDEIEILLTALAQALTGPPA